MDQVPNDNHIASGTSPDPHGQAAILLVESLIHALVQKDLIDIHEAIETVEVAFDVSGEIGVSRGDTPEVQARSRQLLEAIRDSLEFDLPSADSE